MSRSAGASHPASWDRFRGSRRGAATRDIGRFPSSTMSQLMSRIRDKKAGRDMACDSIRGAR